MSGESIHPDHLGTPREITDDAGKTVWQWSGEAFGASAPNEDPNGTGSKFTFSLRFSGQYFDAETGLHYNGFRTYSPQNGRYLESDPIGLAGGINTFSYTGGNPISRIDPRGLDNLGMGPYGAPVYKPYPAEPSMEPILTPVDFLPFPVRWAKGLFAGCAENAAGKAAASAINRSIAKLPPPAVPADMTRAYFGEHFISWGDGGIEALDRIANITGREVAEMQKRGLTREMAEAWRNFYANEFARNPNNSAAQYRAHLMESILHLMG